MPRKHTLSPEGRQTLHDNLVRRHANPDFKPAQLKPEAIEKILQAFEITETIRGAAALTHASYRTARKYIEAAGKPKPSPPAKTRLERSWQRAMTDSFLNMRHLVGDTVEEFAETLGIDPSLYEPIEHATFHIAPSFLKKIAERLVEAYDLANAKPGEPFYPFFAMFSAPVPAFVSEKKTLKRKYTLSPEGRKKLLKRLERMNADAAFVKNVKEKTREACEITPERREKIVRIFEATKNVSHAARIAGGSPPTARKYIVAAGHKPVRGQPRKQYPSGPVPGAG